MNFVVYFATMWFCLSIIILQGVADVNKFVKNDVVCVCRVSKMGFENGRLYADV